MIRMLKKLLEAPGRTPPPRQEVERFGEIALPRELGRTLLGATPKCRVYADRMRDRLEHLTRDEMPNLVDRVLERLALYVLDLPASERNHHAQPFGLLEHSLEVAYGTLAALSGSSFRVSPDPLVDHRERPRWIYAAFVGALAHDLAKTFGIEVRLPGESGPWNPLREPLAAYALRSGRTETGSAAWTFRRGRGLEGQADRTGELLGEILTPEAERYLGDRRAILEQLFPAGRPRSFPGSPRPPGRSKPPGGRSIGKPPAPISCRPSDPRRPKRPRTLRPPPRRPRNSKP